MYVYQCIQVRCFISEVVGEQCGSFMGADIHWWWLCKAPKTPFILGAYTIMKKQTKIKQMKEHIASLAPLQSTRKCKWQSAKPETHEMKQHPQAKKGQFHPNACLHYQDSYSSTVWTLYTFIKPSGMLSLVFQVDCLNLTLMTLLQDLELV